MKKLAKIAAALGLITTLSAAQQDTDSKLTRLNDLTYSFRNSREGFVRLKNGYFINRYVLADMEYISDMLLFRAFPQAGRRSFNKAKRIYKENNQVEIIEDFLFYYITGGNPDRVITLSDYNTIKEDLYKKVLETYRRTDSSKYEEYGMYYIPRGERGTIDIILRRTMDDKGVILDKTTELLENDKILIPNKKLFNTVLQELSGGDYIITMTDISTYRRKYKDVLSMRFEK